MLTIPNKLPYHFKREHIPTGRVWLGEFNGTHNYCFTDERWARTSTATMISEINSVVDKWNRQQPATWRYTALLGPCPDQSGQMKAPCGAWFTN